MKIKLPDHRARSAALALGYGMSPSLILRSLREDYSFAVDFLLEYWYDHEKGDRAYALYVVLPFVLPIRGV